MKSQGKHVMDFIERLGPQWDVNGAWDWSAEAEANLDKFLKQYPDPRLKDAKDEVGSLRMELRETRKTLESAQKDIGELEESLRYAQSHYSDDVGQGEFR